jgi:membrane protein implicated in regulation of membrane protease activity
VKTLVTLANKVLRRPKIALVIITLGALIAGGLAYLGTTNVWLCAVTFLGALVILRTWWVCERRRTQDSELIQAAQAVSRVVKSVDVLSLEVAGLSVHTQSLANRDN